MAGFETYLDAVVAKLEAAKEGLGVETIFDEIDWENDIPRSKDKFPIIMVDGGTMSRGQANQVDKTFSLTIAIFVIAESQNPFIYNAARAQAWDIEDQIAELQLRFIESFEEPDDVESAGGKVAIGDYNGYMVVMTVSTITPFIRTA